MRALFLALFICPFCFGLTAQNATKGSWLHAGITLSMPYQDKNTTTQNSPENNFQTTYSYQEKAAVHLGIGLQQVQENGWYRNYALMGLVFSHQDDVTTIEIPEPGFVEPVGGNSLTRMEVYTRIEFGKIFAKSESTGLRPSLGVSIDPYYQFRHLLPKTSAGFPRSAHNLGLTFRAIPGLAFQMNSKFQLATRIAVGINNLEYEYHRVDNPILTDGERKIYRAVNQLGFYDVQATLGLHMKL